MSTCLFDHIGVRRVNTPIGPPAEPVAVCSHCHSLSCGYHGVLTTDLLFLCVLCSGSSLMTGAIFRWYRSNGKQTLPLHDAKNPAPEGGAARAYHLALVLGSLFATPAGTPSRIVATTLKQWLDERPDYTDLMNGLLDGGLAALAVSMIDEYLGVGPEPTFNGEERVDRRYEDNTDGVRSLWARLDREGRLMVAAALILMVALDPESGKLRARLPAPVAEIYDRLGGFLRQSPKIREFCGTIVTNEVG